MVKFLLDGLKTSSLEVLKDWTASLNTGREQEQYVEQELVS